MTNAEKYLKDGVNARELFLDFKRYGCKHNCYLETDEFVAFMQEQAKPILTEDERVILRFIDNKYTHIQRDCGLWLVNYEDEYNAEMLSFAMYSHLFQFIKTGEEYSIEELLKDE